MEDLLKETRLQLQDTTGIRDIEAKRARRSKSQNAESPVCYTLRGNKLRFFVTAYRTVALCK